MKIKNVKQVEDFTNAIDKCHGDVWITSNYGDRLNLKSVLSRYVAIGKLLDEHGDELELWCDLKEDEHNFMKFFNEHPEVINDGND